MSGKAASREKRGHTQSLIVIITSWFEIALDELRNRRILREKGDCKQSIPTKTSSPLLFWTPGWPGGGLRPASGETPSGHVLTKSDRCMHVCVYVCINVCVCPEPLF